MGRFVLPDLRGRDLVQQLLNESERTEPAAYRPSEHESPQHDDAENIESGPVP